MKTAIKELAIGDLVELTTYTQLWTGENRVPAPRLATFIFLGKKELNVPTDVFFYFWCDGKMYFTRDGDQSVIIVGKVDD